MRRVLILVVRGRLTSVALMIASFLTVPMRNHDGEIIGVLQLINALDEEGEVVLFDEHDQLWPKV